MSDPTTEMEIKLAFLEHHVGELDGALRLALDRIDALRGEVARLEGRVIALAQAEASPGGHERPPHHLPDPVDG
ncbi:MAG: SlyX family protein [Alphaproteobacteria bacterium]|nr:SlyX family protein [Alphaproteobacteria bacterium]